MIEIVDLNLPERKQVIAETSYSDIAQILALGYMEARYGSRLDRGLLGKNMKDVIVRDRTVGKTLYRYGPVRRLVLARRLARRRGEGS